MAPREEEPLNHHETPGKQIKQSNQLSLPHQDDCNTRTDTKQVHYSKPPLASTQHKEFISKKYIIRIYIKKVYYQHSKHYQHSKPPLASTQHEEVISEKVQRQFISIFDLDL